MGKKPYNKLSWKGYNNAILGVAVFAILEFCIASLGARSKIEDYFTKGLTSIIQFFNKINGDDWCENEMISGLLVCYLTLQFFWPDHLTEFGAHDHQKQNTGYLSCEILWVSVTWYYIPNRGVEIGVSGELANSLKIEEIVLD